MAIARKDPCVIGVDLGGTNIRAAIVDSAGEILSENKRATLAERPYEEILRDIVGCIGAATIGSESRLPEIKAIGIGSPGPLDPISGRVQAPPNLPTMRNVPLRDDIAKRFRIPIALANDAYCAGLGECWLGAGRNYQNDRVAGVTLGTGFGSWAKGLTPEFGHTISIDNHGALCKCGRRGCPEAYVSSYGIVRLAARCCLEIKEVSELGDLLQRESPLAEMVVRLTGKYLGRTFVNIVHVYRPRLIVVGGSIAKLGKMLFESAEFEMRMWGFKDVTQGVTIVPAELGDNAGVLGAARLALDSFTGGGA
jgi:glucokinase